MLMTTGATGYLGSALVHLLVRRGYDVRAVVRDRARAEALLPPGVELAVTDLGDVDGLRRAAAGCSAVLHLAGTVGGTP
jgi:dihydroflavonol-4-reductase